jgi:hypothetical protein
MNKVEIGFFSFTEVTDPKEHRSYNEWHQLDHLPEQIPLPGVVHGQRWVSTPACRRARVAAAPPLDRVQYLTLYLMSGPEAPVVERFRNWGERLSELGRFHRHRVSHLSGAFLFLKAYAAPRVLISPEAIPYRPCRGLHVTVTEPIGRPDAPPDPLLEDYAQWLDRVRLRDLLTVPGVAGVWTFVGRSTRFHDAADGRRITVAYLDDDPLAVAERLVEKERTWARQGKTQDWSRAIRIAYSGPFETITPWQWDWFEGES